MARQTPLNPLEKVLVMQTVTWVKTVNDAKPAGAPASYPAQADIDSSALFARIRLGLAPMAWAPPTRSGQPCYELIESARERQRVMPGDGGISGDSVVLDGARWSLLHSDPARRTHHVAFGRWPIAYRLEAEDVPRWSEIGDEVDVGDGNEVVRLRDGRIVAKQLIRSTRHEVQTLWWLHCVSPLDERLYLHAQREPLDDPDHFRPLRIHSEVAGVPQVFVCALRQGETLMFPLATDPWTRITRHLGVPARDVTDLSACLTRIDRGESPLDFLPHADDCWSVFELDAHGQPWSAWRTDRREWLLAVAE